MLKSSITLLLIITLPGFSLLAQTSWDLKKDKNNILIYSRPSVNSKFNELKVVFDMPGTLNGLHTILCDVSGYKGWVYSTEYSTLIDNRNDSEIVYYSKIAAPWPAANRDFYSDTHICVDSSGRQMRVSSRNVVGYPLKDNLVRVPFLKADWLVTALSPILLHVEYTLSWNPGGNVPSWIANMFATNGPYESFSQLKKKMALLLAPYAVNK